MECSDIKRISFVSIPIRNKKYLLPKPLDVAALSIIIFWTGWNTAYQEIGKSLTYNTCAGMLSALKKAEETEWLKEVDSIALQSFLQYLKDSFSRFFKRKMINPSS